MELIIISESKLKIMLSAPDMARYELESNRMDCGDVRTRAAFRHIFDDARAEIGFDTEGERLYVQFYASKEGGCEIFVTKLGRGDSGTDSGGDAGDRELLRRILEESEEAADREEGEDMEDMEDMAEQPEPAESRREGAGEEGPHTGESRSLTLRWEQMPGIAARRAAVVFSDMTHLLAVCRRLLGEGYRGRSTVYLTESVSGRDWYLFLDVPDVAVSRLPRRFAFLCEFGREVDPLCLETYLIEYGTCIRRGDGVEVLGRM